MDFFEKLNLSVSTTLTGLVIVFATLIALTLLFVLFGKTLQLAARNKKVTAQYDDVPQMAVKAPMMVQTVPAVDDDEIIAVIAAAVASIGTAAGREYRIRKVVPVSGRSEWAVAGLLDNTRPF